jgi:hypothetical protein
MDELLFGCGQHALVAWAVRGHTLSRTERSTVRSAAPWSVSRELATGVSELAMLSDGENEGLPLAWRSPTAQVEGLDTDEWWVLSQQFAKGSLALPQSASPAGIIVATTQTATTVAVLSSLRDAQRGSYVVTDNVLSGSGEYHRRGDLPASLASGELRAFEPSHRVFVTIEPAADTPGPDASAAPGAAHNRLTAWQLTAQNAPTATRLGSVDVRYRYVRLVAQGVAHATQSTFAFSGFEREPSDSVACILVGPSMCVRTGPVTIVTVDTTRSTLATHVVAPSGLPDSLSRTDADDGYWLLYVHGSGTNVLQSVAEFADQSQTARTRPLLGQGLPPLDRLSLRRCGNRVWLGAEAVIAGDELAGPDESVDDASLDAAVHPAPSEPEARGVIALPLSCVLGQ